jgi:hypothetical protein
MRYPESEEVVTLKRRVESFVERYVYPNEERFYKKPRSLALSASKLPMVRIVSRRRSA